MHVQTFLLRSYIFIFVWQITISSSATHISSEDYIILIPTYEGHFKHVQTFLGSVLLNVVDKKLFHIYYIVSNEMELQSLTNMLLTWRHNLNVHVRSVGDLVKIISNKTMPDVYGGHRINLQTIKKLYGLQSINFKYALWMDSEAIVRKSGTKICDIFRKFFDKPMYFWEENRAMDRFTLPTLQIHHSSENNLPHKHAFFFQYQGWFVEKTYFSSYWRTIESKGKSVYDVITGINDCCPFATMGYFQYLYQHRMMNNLSLVQFPNAIDALRNYLNESDIEHVLSVQRSPIQGVLEGLSNWLTKPTTLKIVAFLESINWSMYRYDGLATQQGCLLKQVFDLTKSMRLQVCSIENFPSCP